MLLNIAGMYYTQTRVFIPHAHILNMSLFFQLDLISKPSFYKIQRLGKELIS